jgi:hypothetical protein
MKNRGLKIFSATAMVIFNLVICFMATFAWFVNTKMLDGNEMAIQMDAHELHLDYQILKFDDDQKQVIEIDSFNLNQYDSIIKERNTKTAIVLKVDLMSNLFLNKTVSDVDISLKCTETDSTTNYLSNITHFKFGTTAINSDDITTIYDTTVSNLESVTPLKFITTVKLTEVNFTIQAAPIVDGKITVYGVFNYDEDLLNALHINIFSDPDVNLAFLNDIEYVRYGVHE